MTRDELGHFLRENKKRGGFQFDHEAITPFWEQLLKKMMDFNVDRRMTFDDVQKEIEQFKPSSQMRPERPFSED